MPNSSHPVTHWLAVGPFFSSGSETERDGVMDFMFTDATATQDYSQNLADEWFEQVTVVVSPTDPVA